MSVSCLGRSYSVFWPPPPSSWWLSCGWGGIFPWQRVRAWLCVLKQQRSSCLGLVVGGLMPAVLGSLVGAWLCSRWACGLQILDAP